MEQDPGIPPSREQQLASLLSSDFRPPKDPEPVPEGDALAAFLRQVRPAEEIDARFESDENERLGDTVGTLLEPAPVTDAFKEVIAYEVRRAHAWRTAMSDALAPDRLGLLSGPSLFDPAQAQEIEAQALRGYLVELTRAFNVRIGADASSPVLPRPGVRPRDGVEAFQRLERWGEDFVATYDADPLEGMDLEAFEAAALGDPIGDLVKRLKELDDRGQDEL